MNNSSELWISRRNEYWKMAIRYLKLIGNSGFLFSLYLLFVFGSYYYATFIEWLPPAVPVALLFVLLFSWMETRGRVRTFFQSSDLFFLLPIEGKLMNYFRSALKYSWMMETFWLLLIMMVLTPLFVDRVAGEQSYFWSAIFILIILKGINLAVSFEEQRINDRVKNMMFTFSRFFMNGFVLVALFMIQSLLITFFLLFLYLLCYIILYRKIKRTKGLKWERLIEIEEQTVMTFYRIANSFTDVPKLKGKVRARKWLNPLLAIVPSREHMSYHYLIGRSFFRSNDYFGIYLRLTFLGILFLSAVTIFWGQLLLAFLFSYMSALQIKTLNHHFRTTHLLDFYPVEETSKKAAIKFWQLRLGVAQSFTFMVVYLVQLEWIAAGSIVIVSLATVFYVRASENLNRRKKRSSAIS